MTSRCAAKPIKRPGSCCLSAVWLISLVLFLLSRNVSAEDRIANHLRFLASDSLKGRGNHQPEIEIAAGYIVDEFRRLGLQPGFNENGYYQSFQVSKGVEAAPSTSVSVVAGGEEPEPLVLGEDYVVVAFGGEARVSGPLVFAGFGISAPEVGYDDYRALDAAGKVIVVFENEPERIAEASGLRMHPSPYSSVMTKVLTAKYYGASAVVILPDMINQSPSDADLQGFRQDSIEDLGIPAIRVNTDWAFRLIRLGGRNLLYLRHWLNHQMTPCPYDFLGARIRLDLHILEHSSQVSNVAGMLPGSGPGTVVIGAHYDHLGMGSTGSLTSGSDTDQIYNGADDNASGVAGLLELAALAAQSKNWRHNLLFVSFAGEELGLVGSRFFVEHPPGPLESVMAMLNLDMIGRSEERLLVGGVGTAREFERLVREVARHSPVRLEQALTPGTTSDHFSFVEKSIPVLFFFSGLHEDYHTVSDEYEKVSLTGIRHVVDIGAGILRGLDSLDRLAFVDLTQVYGNGLEAAVSSRPFLGTILDMRYEGPGVRLADLTPSGPAAEAGLQAGDVLVGIDRHNIDNVRDFSFVIQRCRPGQEISLTVLRGYRRVVVAVTLGFRE